MAGAGEKVQQDYKVAVGAMAAIIGLAQGQRPGVISHLTVQEWDFANQAQAVASTDCGELRVVYVFQHKNASTAGPACFTLTEKELEVFQLYDKFYRPLVTTKRQPDEHFILNSTGRQIHQQVSQLLSRFQKEVVGNNFIPMTITDARKAIETANLSGHVFNQSGDQRLVCSFLKHTKIMAQKKYARQTVQKVHIFLSESYGRQVNYIANGGPGGGGGLSLKRGT